MELDLQEVQRCHEGISKAHPILEADTGSGLLEDIVAQAEETSLALNPRQYQVSDLISTIQNIMFTQYLSLSPSLQSELYEKAKTQNVIACLGTGSGKTLISVMLLKVSTAHYRAVDCTVY